MDSATALREFLEYIIGQLIDQPDQASIAHEYTESTRKHFFRVCLTEEDVGRIIGKNGHTVTAIRGLLNAAAARENATVALKIVAHGDLAPAAYAPDDRDDTEESEGGREDDS